MSEEILEFEILLIFLHQKIANSILSTQKHRGLRWEGTWRSSGPNPLKAGSKRLLRIIASCILNYLSLIQCLITLTGQNFLLLFNGILFVSICAHSLLPFLDTSGKGILLSSLHHPVFIQKDEILPKPSLLKDNILINISKTLIKYVNIYVYFGITSEISALIYPWF